MMKIFYQLLALSTFLALLACGQPPTSGITPFSPTTGITTRWDDSSLPLVIKVPADFNPYWPDVVSVQNEYNSRIGRTVITFYQSPELSPQFDDIVTANANMSLNMMIYFQHTSWYSSNASLAPTAGILALTCYGLNSADYLTRAMIIFNFYSFYLVDVWNNQSGYDFSTILRHEVGHVLGLSHITAETESDSVMNPYINLNTDKPLSARDVARLKSLYNP